MRSRSQQVKASFKGVFIVIRTIKGTCGLDAWVYQAYMYALRQDCTWLPSSAPHLARDPVSGGFLVNATPPLAL